jgi:hypothetical protein
MKRIILSLLIVASIISFSVSTAFSFLEFCQFIEPSCALSCHSEDLIMRCFDISQEGQ